VCQANAGPSAARNAGACAADGTVLAFLDADDRWRPDLLSRMLEKLATTGADAVVCATRLIDAEGNPTGLLRMAPMPTLESMVMLRANLTGVGSSLVVDRGAFDAVGGFDEQLSAGEDWELLSRILTSLRLAYLDEPLAEYRRHAEARSRNIDAMARNMLRAYEIVFERAGGELRPLRRRAYARLHRMLSGSFADAGRPGRAAVHAARSASYSPLSVAEIVRPALRRVGSAPTGERSPQKP
jgi:glycosyltransferase involved in cell wall biosynthesis